MLYTLATLAQAAPAIPPIRSDKDAVGVIDAFARHAEAWPITVGFFCFLALLAGLLYWLLFRFWPTWQAEQKETRAHREAEGEKFRSSLQAVLHEKDKSAAASVAEERAAGKERHSEIVGQVSGRVDRIEGKMDKLVDKHEQLHAKVESVERKASAIAAKVGVLAVVVLALAGAASSAVMSIPRLRVALGHTLGASRYPACVSCKTDRSEPVVIRLVEDTKKTIKCDPACSKGFYCCGTNKCCEEKKDTAGGGKGGTAITTGPVPDGGHSAGRIASFAPVASGWCDRRRGCL